MAGVPPIVPHVFTQLDDTLAKTKQFGELARL